MKLLNTLCQQLGISHQQMAKLIGATRSSVTKTINGSRSLSYEPVLALVQLQKTLEELPAENRHTTCISAMEKERWDWLIQGQQIALRQLQKRIDRLTEKQAAACLLLNLLDTKLADPNTDPGQQKYLLLLQETTKSKLRKCSPALVQRLRIRARLIQQEIEWMQEALPAFEE